MTGHWLEVGAGKKIEGDQHILWSILFLVGGLPVVRDIYCFGLRIFVLLQVQDILPVCKFKIYSFMESTGVVGDLGPVYMKWP
jgi:hypothetical protein